MKLKSLTYKMICVFVLAVVFSLLTFYTNAFAKETDADETLIVTEESESEVLLAFGAGEDEAKLEDELTDKEDELASADTSAVSEDSTNIDTDAALLIDTEIITTDDASTDIAGAVDTVGTMGTETAHPYTIIHNEDGTMTVITEFGRYITIEGAELDANGVPYGTQATLVGDLNDDGMVTDADVAYLWGYLFTTGGSFPLNQGCDFDESGVVDAADLKLLLMHVHFGTVYELQNFYPLDYEVEGYAMVSNCGKDENGKYHGGKAGDQTGNEWYIRSWYDKSWTYVLRYTGDRKDEVTNLIKAYSISAAYNDHIGYDQGDGVSDVTENDRYTFWFQLVANNYNPARITVDCETDCSGSVAAIVKAVGFTLEIEALKNVSYQLYSGNIAAVLKKAGFTILSNDAYLDSGDYLQAGDILVKEGQHVCIVASNGKKADETVKWIVESCTITETIVKSNSYSYSAYNLQRALNYLGYTGTDDKSRLTEDGYFGANSIYALTTFQKDYSISETVDGGKIAATPTGKTITKINYLLSHTKTLKATTSAHVYVNAGASYDDLTSKDASLKTVVGNNYVVTNTRKGLNASGREVDWYFIPELGGWVYSGYFES